MAVLAMGMHCLCHHATSPLPAGSQPRAGRRLAGGPTPCEGHIEVFQRGHWHMLCDEQVHRVERSRQLCRELRCGDLSFSTELRDSHASGIICKERYLHLCPESSKEVQGCSRTHVVCKQLCAHSSQCHSLGGATCMVTPSSPRPEVEATSCWHRPWHSGQHLPGPAPAGSPAAHLWPPCLQEADEEE